MRVPAIRSTVPTCVPSAPMTSICSLILLRSVMGLSGAVSQPTFPGPLSSSGQDVGPATCGDTPGLQPHHMRGNARDLAGNVADIDHRQHRIVAQLFLF